MWHSSGWRCTNRQRTLRPCCCCTLPLPLLVSGTAAAADGGGAALSWPCPSLLAPLTTLLLMPLHGSRLVLLLMRAVSLLMRPQLFSPPRVCSEPKLPLLLTVPLAAKSAKL